MVTPRRLIIIGCTTLLSASVPLFAQVPAQAIRLPVASKTAQATVLKVVPGSLVKISRAKRDGFKAWAITVKRVDGSIVVGYVDRRSGHVFDWTVQQAPDEPVIDLDGPDKSRKPAPLPPAVGEPLPDDATVDSPTSRGVPTPPAPPTPPGPSAVAASADHEDHSDEDGPDHSSDQSSGSKTHDSPEQHSEASHESDGGDDHDSDGPIPNDHDSDDRDSHDDHSDDRDSDD